MPSLNDRSGEIAELLATGITVMQAAVEIGATYWQVYHVVRDNQIPLPPLQGRKVPRAKRDRIYHLLRTTNKSPSEIQRELGLASRSTIYRARGDMQRQHERKAGAFQPNRSQKPKRCPTHGLVHVWPCVACSANGIDSRKPAVEPFTPFEAARVNVA